MLNENPISLFIIRVRQTIQFFRGGIPQVMLSMYKKIFRERMTKEERKYLTRLFIIMNIGEITFFLLTKIYKIDEKNAKEITSEIIDILTQRINTIEYKKEKEKIIPSWYS